MAARMSRANAARVVHIAAALLVSCSNTSGGPPGAGGYREPSVVQFSYQAVIPETVRIPADGNLTWVNTAADTSGTVVFPASIAASFRCPDLRPYFSKAADVYRSLPITDTQSERVQLPCRLAPGTYDYEIWLRGSGFGEESDAARPDQILRARIVVE
jgi:hypothetical protein